MKKYLLLRKNRRSGPYSIEQMSSMGLLPLDLIWIEEESSSWKYPEEIEELKAFIRCEETIEIVKLSSDENVPVSISHPSPAIRNDDPVILPADEMVIVSKVNMNDPTAIKENYRTPGGEKPIWNKPAASSKNISGVAAVCIGVMLGAFIIKKWVDNSVPDTTERTEAVPAIDRQPTVTEPNENFKHALVTEIVPVYKRSTPNKTPRTADVKKQLKLQSNDYKVGLFGGINGLQLTVFNTSAQYVDKVIVALDYLKPNGAVVQSEDILFTAIKPKDAQTIAIPGSDRGVKVRYKILKVYSHSYRADLKQA